MSQVSRKLLHMKQAILKSSSDAQKGSTDGDSQDSQDKVIDYPPQKDGEFTFSIRIQLCRLLQKSLFFSIFLQIIVAIYLYAIFQAVQQKKVQEILIKSRNNTLMQTGQNKGSIIQTQLQMIVNQINMKGDIWDELTENRLKYHRDIDFEWSGSYQGIYYDLYFGRDVSQTQNIKVNDQIIDGEYKKNPWKWEKGEGKQVYNTDEKVQKVLMEQPYDQILDGYYITFDYNFIIGAEDDYELQSVDQSMTEQQLVSWAAKEAQQRGYWGFFYQIDTNGVKQLGFFIKESDLNGNLVKQTEKGGLGYWPPTYLNQWERKRSWWTNFPSWRYKTDKQYHKQENLDKFSKYLLRLSHASDSIFYPLTFENHNQYKYNYIGFENGFYYMLFEDFSGIPQRSSDRSVQSIQQQELIEIQMLEKSQSRGNQLQKPRNLKWYGQTNLECQAPQPIQIITQEKLILNLCSKVEDGNYIYSAPDWCHCMYADYCETKEDNPFYKDDLVWQVDQSKLSDPKVLSYYQQPFPYNLNTNKSIRVDPSYDPRCRSWYQNAVVKQDKVLINDPYQDTISSEVYINFSKFKNKKISRSITDYDKENIHSVMAIDINLGWQLYKQTINDSILDRYYITKTQEVNGQEKQIILSHSKIESELLDKLYNISYIEYNVNQTTGKPLEEANACENETSEYYKECQAFTDKVNQMNRRDFTQNEEVTIKGIKYLLTLVPIKLEVADGSIENTMNIIMLYTRQDFVESLGENSVLNDKGFYISLSFNILFIIISLVLFSYFAFKTSHYLFRPLRELNAKMRTILNETNSSKDIQQQKETSADITSLYVVFKTHLKAKKFESNAFLEKEDALAVIDLAEACKMFLEETQVNNDGETVPAPNYKTAGICFNNIGNIWYKQGKYDQAAENFKLAIKQADHWLKQYEGEDTENQIFSNQNQNLNHSSKALDRQKPKNTKELKERLKVRELRKQEREESLLALKEEEEYFKYDKIKILKVKAHRTYMEAMSMYKHMSSGKVQAQDSIQDDKHQFNGINMSNDDQQSEYRSEEEEGNKENKIHYTWYDIDQKFIKAIELYNDDDLKTGDKDEMKFLNEKLKQQKEDNNITFGAKKQPIFIDFILNMILSRVYVNVMDRKLLTAEKILGNAETLIGHINNKAKNTLQIVTFNGEDNNQQDLKQKYGDKFKDYRQEALPINIDYLEKQFFLQQGILFASFEQWQEAQDSFLQSMESGTMMEPIIRIECLKRLLVILKRQGRLDQIPTIETMLNEFKHKNKDIIFLVNEYVKESEVDAKEETITDKISKSFECIFNNHIDYGKKVGKKNSCQGDRVSIMTYGKNVRKLFNLVPMNKNQTQLRNQVKQINFKPTFDPNNTKLKENPNKKIHQNQSISNRFTEHSTFRPSVQIDGFINEQPFDQPVQFQKGNLIKALNTAIDEFIEKGAKIQKLNSTAPTDENKRVLVILTSHFDIDMKRQDNEINEVIMKIHAYRINVLILGFEMNIQLKRQQDKIFQNDSQFQPEFNHLEEETQLQLFVEKVRAFDEKQLPKIKKWLDKGGFNPVSKSPDHKSSVNDTENFTRSVSQGSAGNDDEDSNKQDIVQYQIEKLQTNVLIGKSHKILRVNACYIQKPDVKAIFEEFTKLENFDMDVKDQELIMETFK